MGKDESRGMAEMLFTFFHGPIKDGVVAKINRSVCRALLMLWDTSQFEVVLHAEWKDTVEDALQTKWLIPYASVVEDQVRECADPANDITKLYVTKHFALAVMAMTMPTTRVLVAAHRAKVELGRKGNEGEGL